MHFQFGDNNFRITLSDRLFVYSWTSFLSFPFNVTETSKKTGDYLQFLTCILLNTIMSFWCFTCNTTQLEIS